ncbi:MAG: hypothetical protein WKF47_13340, partial [Geodermatophilaceae bacterium]
MLGQNLDDRGQRQLAGLGHHVPVVGLDVELPRMSFAMTEQPRTITRTGITGRAGATDEATTSTIDQWLRDFANL